MTNDPISDMLTRIRNAMMVGHATVAMPSSNIKTEIARILKEEGYLESYEVVDGEKPTHKTLKVKIKYAGERRSKRPVITGIVRVSRPGRRVYTRKNEIPWVLSGLGISIMSTPQGVMTGQQARQKGVGGEILCKVW
ncbi:MAG: 30S ribosomal protein S8 [Chloroflexi bacterium]|jgi:small subunit ribosomal protein S8|nr:30S ribosomal protein S8 [Chloroflexota bacterium]